jgi:SlyX protein
LNYLDLTTEGTGYWVFLKIRITIMDEKIIELETKFSFQEDTLQQLNEAIVRQQRLIEALVLEVKGLKGQLEDTVEKTQASFDGDAGQEKPPHY